MSNPWKQLFDQQAPVYMQNVFTQWTVPEVRFILDLFQLPRGSRILDLGCGTGRHAIELAKEGYQVTGVDISSGMLAEARTAAEAAGVSCEWIEADATTVKLDQTFDGAICLCEGGFGLVGTQEDPVSHDLAILRTVHSALKPGAPFLLTALNGYSIIRQMTDEHVKEGRFDPSSMMATYVDEWLLPTGTQHVQIRERLFIPPEVVSMLMHVGFRVNNVWGGTAGEWTKGPVKLDEIEAMYFSHKLPG